MSARRSTALAAILLLAAGLRVWGLYHGSTTDENKFVAPSSTLVNRPPDTPWYPKGARYPHAAFYVNGVITMVLERVAPQAPWNHTFVARTIGVVQSVLTVALLFVLGRRLQGVPLGLLAALILAVTPLSVKYAHFAHVDTPVALMMLAAVWASVRLWDDPRPRWYVVTGLLAGLSAATQYYGVLVVLALTLAHVGASVRAERRFKSLRRPAFALGLLSVAVGTFMATPYSFLRWEEALSRYQALSLRAAGGDLGYTSQNLLWPLLTRSPDWGLSFTVSGVVWEVTLPPTLFAVVGLWAAVRRRDWRVVALVGLVAILLYLTMAWHVRMHAVKRFLFLTPLMSLLAAYGLLALRARCASVPLLRRVAFPLFLAAALGWAFWDSVSFDAAYARAITHPAAVAWAKDHLPSGATVLQPGPLTFLPGEDSKYHVVAMREEYANIGGRHDRRVADHRARPLADWLSLGVEYVVLDSRMVDRYYEPTAIRLYPDMTASYRAFYDEIRARGQRVYRIDPAPWRQAGPRMEIYDVRGLRSNADGA